MPVIAKIEENLENKEETYDKIAENLESTEETYFTPERQYTSWWQKLEPYIPSFTISSKSRFLITTKIGGIYPISR